MFQEKNPFLWTNTGKPMTIIKYLVLIRACGAIEPCIFVAYFSTMFPTTESSVHPTFQRNIFLCNMESIMTISRRDICWIRRGGQSTNRIFKGNRYVSWENIWGISSSLSSMVMGGRWIAGQPKSAVKDYWSSHKPYFCCTSILNVSCPHFSLKHHDSKGPSHM